MCYLVGHYALSNKTLTVVSNSFRFATKVWLTSVFLSPFVFFLISGTIDTKKLNMEAAGLDLFLFFSLIFGLIFSLPCWTLLIFAVKFINRQYLTLTKKKALTIVTGIVLTYSLFYLPFFKDRTDSGQLASNMRLATAYCLTIVGGMIFYKLEPDEKRDKKGSTQQVHLQ